MEFLSTTVIEKDSKSKENRKMTICCACSCSNFGICHLQQNHCLLLTPDLQNEEKTLHLSCHNTRQFSFIFPCWRFINCYLPPEKRIFSRDQYHTLEWSDWAEIWYDWSSILSLFRVKISLWLDDWKGFKHAQAIMHQKNIMPISLISDGQIQIVTLVVIWFRPK